jgi:hypothetical protein
MGRIISFLWYVPHVAVQIPTEASEDIQYYTDARGEDLIKGPTGQILLWDLFLPSTCFFCERSATLCVFRR